MPVLGRGLGGIAIENEDDDLDENYEEDSIAALALITR